MKILWLDDLRNPFLDIEGRVPKREGVIEWVLNYEQFTQWIEKFGLPDIISFDHDLADEHYTPPEYWHDYEISKKYQESQDYQEKTGMDCAKWLVDYCMDNGDADYESGKAGKGKKIKTKPSKYTKNEGLRNIMEFNSFISNEIDVDLENLGLNEGSESGSVDNPNSPSYKSLKKKSEKSGFPLGILKQVFKRGKAAWKIGHRPGTTPDQWAHARVNSFIKGGRTTEVSDGALYKQAKEAKARKK